MPDVAPTVAGIASSLGALTASFEKSYADLTNKVNAVSSNQDKTAAAVGAVQQETSANQDTALLVATKQDKLPLYIGGAVAVFALIFLLKK